MAHKRYRDANELNGCIFCDRKTDELIEESEFCYARKDRYPVTNLHTLVIPKRHVETYFELTHYEIRAIHEMLVSLNDKIQNQDEQVTAFNVGVNSGREAGQSVFHVHIHLIPRRKGDVENPQGGVRGVIPNKRTY